MSRPSFQFYPKDWRNNANLGRCSFAARGVWVDVMCVLHDSDEYGVVRWPLRELANSAKVPINHLRELVDKGVLKGIDKGECEPFIYVPRSGRRDGNPVTLIPTQPGPVWYSSRMVKDEYVRGIRGEGTRFGDPDQPSPNASPKPPLSDGAPSSSSSSSSTAVEEKEITKLALGRARPPVAPQLSLVETASEKGKGPPDCPHLEVLELWAKQLPALPEHLASQWKGARADHLRTRWRETAVEEGWTTKEQGLVYFGRLFAYIGRSKFLTGNAPTSPGRSPFVITLAWLVKPENWAKTIEGNYHPEQQA